MWKREEWGTGAIGGEGVTVRERGVGEKSNWSMLLNNNISIHKYILSRPYITLRSFQGGSEKVISRVQLSKIKKQ